MQGSLDTLLICINGSLREKLARELELLPNAFLKVYPESGLSSALLQIKKRNFDVALLDVGDPFIFSQKCTTLIRDLTHLVATIAFAPQPSLSLVQKISSLGALDWISTSELSSTDLYSRILLATERRKKELNLMREIESLQDFHKKKDAFLASLSHELRTPLNVILGNLELLKRYSENVSAECLESLKAIERNAQTEAHLVSDTLEFSRIINGKLSLSKKMLSIEDLLQSSIESIQFPAREKEISVTLDIASKLPTFYGDETRLKQVIWNLLSNAVKFTPPKGSIHVRAFRKSNFFQILVKDSGIGVSPENRNKIFERFWQEPNKTSDSNTGLGLGLSISKHIIELHGGSIGVSSESHKKGSTFIVCLPVNSKQEDTPISPESKVKKIDHFQNQISRTTLSKVKILVIDDSLDSLTLMKRSLEMIGAQVTTTSNAQQGLQLAQENAYDLIISDIGMPNLNGYDLMKNFRNWELMNRPYSTPSIALSAYASDSNILSAYQAGFHSYIAKPYSFIELLDEIRKLIHFNSPTTVDSHTESPIVH